jgi:aldose 1-epimerase
MSIRYAFLKNSNGMTLTVADRGGTAIALTAPDRNGRLQDILLGVDDPAYLGVDYLGALIGRVGNRIRHGTFRLGGQTYHLTINNGRNTLHGGVEGFDARTWKMREFTAPDGPALELTLLSPDGDQGFPGNLAVRVVYTLTDAGTWRIEYWAVTDRPTPVSLTNHAYFNLTGDLTKPVTGHTMQIAASAVTDIDSALVPNGKLVQLDGSPLDFRKPHVVGERIDARDRLLRAGKGYDHNYMIDRKRAKPGALVRCARVVEPESGRAMECWTTLPGVQFYSGNCLGSTPFPIKGGATVAPRTGFCLETQYAPNAVNMPAFESGVLRPGEVWHHITEYRFSVVK